METKKYDYQGIVMAMNAYLKDADESITVSSIIKFFNNAKEIFVKEDTPLNYTNYKKLIQDSTTDYHPDYCSTIIENHDDNRIKFSQTSTNTRCSLADDESIL